MYLLNKASNVGRGGSSGSTGSNPFGDVQPMVLLVVAVVALIIAIVLLVTVVERKKAFRGRFLNWLREYLNFRSILISGIIKFVYLFLATFLTIMSIVVMCSGRDDMVLPMIGIGLAILVFGNVFLRIMLEMSMALIVVWENTSDIRGVIVRKDETPEQKTPKEPREKKEEEVAEPVAETVVVEQQQVEVTQPGEEAQSAEVAQVAEVVQPEATASETAQPEVPQDHSVAV